MKHFIGGWAMGFIFLAIFGNQKLKTWTDIFAFCAAACLFGVAAWGLMP